jgi:hypothetical protein
MISLPPLRQLLVGELKEGQNGGLYGLTFFDASFRPEL